ncbi:MAG TPA: hypothetical protein VEK11_05440 [Thermoanaerobaculia bacterium]|nr:hypothetical protein [Thermoanaerobaculia bacterium]
MTDKPISKIHRGGIPAMLTIVAVVAATLSVPAFAQHDRQEVAVAPAVEVDLDPLDLDFEFDFESESDSDGDVDAGPHGEPEASTTRHDGAQNGRRTGAKLTIDELISLRVHGVTPAYIEEMRAIFPDASLKQIAAMRMHGVTAAFVKRLSDAGYANLSARELIRLAAAGVNADFIREIEQYQDKKR